MKKYVLLMIGLYLLVFQLSAQPKLSRTEKKKFSNIEEVHFEHLYGNITVAESDSKQIELEIQYFDGEKTKYACDISVSGKVLKIKTVIPPNRNHRNKSDQAQINYIIVVPKNVAMNVNLKYGNINMGDFYGDFKGDVDYGNLNVNTFFSSRVLISSEYSNIEIGKVDVLNLSISYGNMEINTVNLLKIQSKYTKHEIGEIKTMKANCSYGNIHIDSVLELEAELHYTPATVKNLDKKLKLKCSYSDIKINDTSKRLEIIQFDGNYSNLRLGLDLDLSADFAVDLKYGDLSVDNKYKVKYHFSETDYEKTVKKGTIGNKTPTAKIHISDSYSNVSIK
jgi:hypothetical protein